ncbi:MAG: DUF445 domain-containing protein [Pseudomonadota bacterium]
MLNKNIVTNLVALTILILGFVSPVYNNILKMTGLFALSGGLTNWLAVYMLFDKIPLIYGSGVIPQRFNEFKLGIKKLILEQFFTHENIKKFFAEKATGNLNNIFDNIDFDLIYEELIQAILESPLGNMVAMMGGKQALDPIKDPIIEKLKAVIIKLQNSDNKQAGDAIIDQLIEQVEQIIENRLAELTPKSVKDIIQQMIRQHLGWLVVWGGVFGGLIGLIVSLL